MSTNALPTQQDTYESFTWSTDVTQGVNVTSFNGTTWNPITLSSQFRTFGISGLQNYPEIYAKLNYYMHMYQEYRVGGITVEWIPITNLDGQNTSNFISYNSGGVQPLTAGLFSRYAEICFVPDRNDNVIRPYIDEYFQARLSPNARNFPLLSRQKIEINPGIMNVVQRQSQYFGQQNPTLDLNTITSTVQDSTEPIPAPWMATKAVDGTGKWQTNVQMNYLGLRVYFYYPFNSSTTANQTVDIGMFRTTYKLGFRFPDFRAMPALGEFENLLTQNNEDLQTVLRIKGEAMKLQDTGAVTFAPSKKQVNERKYAEAQGFTNTDDGTLNAKNIKTNKQILEEAAKEEAATAETAIPAVNYPTISKKAKLTK